MTIDINKIATDLNGKADVDLTNVVGAMSESAKNYFSGAGMPSNSHIDLTLGASGTIYTAPANGYFDLRKSATSGQYIKMNGKLEICINSTGDVISGFYPVIKGDECIINYTASGTTHCFRFVYAEGEQ